MIGPPLFVDLDGTLVKTDVFAESVLSMARSNPLKMLMLPLWLARGRSHAKAFASRYGPISVDHLPFCDPVVQYLKEQKSAGRRIHLSTAAHRTIADRVASHVGVFDEIIASAGGTNTKGAAKLEKIRAIQRGAAFAYAGNSAADQPLWGAAERCVFVNAPRRAIAEATKAGKVERVFTIADNQWSAAGKALRPHQWVKNLLVFVPLLTSHGYSDPASISAAVLAFLALCMCASALYVFNDLLDIQADRLHPEKRRRPLAAGSLSIATAVTIVPLLLGAGFGLAAVALPLHFMLWLGVYCVVSLAYSLWIKRVSTLDVFALAGLYTTRVIAGSAAIVVAPSFWLLAFSMFFFLSLAFVKRYIELNRARDAGNGGLSGRGYSSVDMETTFTLGAVAGGLAVLVVALYINSQEVKAHYRTPEFLWLLCPALLYWINRVWVGARRGKINDDPVLFAIKDRVSLIVMLCCMATIAAARLI